MQLAQPTRREGSQYPDTGYPYYHGQDDDAVKHGPEPELCEMKGPEQNQTGRPSDQGLQHFAEYVDDIRQANSLIEGAGGKMFTTPQPLMFPTETGENNVFCFGRTP